MTQARTISEVLAKLILQGDVPLRAIVLAGEAIAADARLSDYNGEGRTVRATGEELHLLLENYGALLARCELLAKNYLEDRDGHSLVDGLGQIKSTLVDLY